MEKIFAVLLPKVEPNHFCQNSMIKAQAFPKDIKSRNCNKEQKKHELQAENYRPMSLLSTISKVQTDVKVFPQKQSFLPDHVMVMWWSSDVGSCDSGRIFSWRLKTVPSCYSGFFSFSVAYNFELFTLFGHHNFQVTH